jgi:hypothetical protein
VEFRVLVAPGLGGGGGGASEGLFFDREGGVEVDLGGLNVFVLDMRVIWQLGQGSRRGLCR